MRQVYQPGEPLAICTSNTARVSPSLGLDLFPGYCSPARLLAREVRRAGTFPDAPPRGLVPRRGEGQHNTVNAACWVALWPSRPPCLTARLGRNVQGHSAQTLPWHGRAKLCPKAPNSLNRNDLLHPKRASPSPYFFKAFFKPAVGKRSASGRRRKGECGQLAHRVSGCPHACRVDRHVVQHGETVTGSELTVCAFKPDPGRPDGVTKSSCSQVVMQSLAAKWSETVL